MFTRSQSLAKRKAEEQLSGPESPSKASKSNSFDDSRTRRRKRAANLKSDKAHKGYLGAVDEADEAASNHSEERVPSRREPAPRSTHNVASELETPASPIEGNASADESPHETGERRAGTPGEDELETPASPSEGNASDESPHETGERRAGTPGEDQQDEDSQKEAATDRSLAKEVIRRLQLILERWRLDDGAAMPDGHDTKQLDNITSLCDLLTIEENTHANPFLKALPQPWWQDMRDLKGRLGHLRKSHEQLLAATEEFDRCSAIYDTAVAKRGDAFLGVGDRSRVAKKLLRETVLQARESWCKTQEAWTEARNGHSELRNRTWAMISHVLIMANNALVYQGYLRYWTGIESVAASQDGSGDGEAVTSEEGPPTPTHARYQSGQLSGYTPQRLDSSAVERRRVMHEEERHQNQLRAEEQDKNGHPALDDIVGDLRQDQRQRFERWTALYHQSLKKFDAVRNRYYGDLLNFTEKQRKNAILGTRTDFDHGYYLARGKANHDVAAARDELEFAIEQADMTGALTLAQRIRLFQDEADSQRGEGGENAVTRMLREMSNERIEIWRRDEKQKEIVGKDHWQTLVEGWIQEGKTISSVAEPEEEERFATGKRRKDIDEWRRQQEKVRSKTAFAVLPSMLPQGAELQWFEGWHGM